MIKTKKFEYVTFTCLIFLLVFGLIVLYSASKQNLFIRQSLFCGIGILITLMVSFIPYKLYIKVSNYIFIICFILVIVSAFAGRVSRGSSRWMELRGIIFQPSELMKLALILNLSNVLTKNIDKLEDKNVFLKVMGIAYLPTFVVALNNLSTGIILFLIATFMIFMISKKKLIFVFILSIIIVLYIFAEPISRVLYSVGILKQYQLGRILAWKNPENYPDTAYQTLQGLYAIGSGRITGRGYHNSIQKAIIPEAHNDMIFTILCEELGLIGAFLFIFIYIILIYRILFISFKLKDMTASLIAYGIGIHIALQVILNIGVVTNILPNTGVTLPFVSYGGSSLMVLFIEMGIVMSLSRYNS